MLRVLASLESLPLRSSRLPAAARRISLGRTASSPPLPPRAPLLSSPPPTLALSRFSSLCGAQQLRMGDLGCASVRGAGGGARSCSSSAESKPHSAKIDALVEQIAALSLLEASELTEALKTKLGISSAMMMPSGGGGGGGGGGAAAPAAEEAEAVVEKTHFTVKLEAFDAASKIKLIKEVRAITGLGLKEAKECVEKAPSELKADVKKDEAEAIKEKLEAVGGTVSLE